MSGRMKQLAYVGLSCLMLAGLPLAGGVPTARADGLEAPAALTASAVSGTQIDLSWLDQSDEESGYRVERREAGGAWQEIAVLPADTESYQDDGVVGNNAYEYRVYAYAAEIAQTGDDFESGDLSAWTVAEGPADWSVVSEAGSKRLTVANPSTASRILAWGDPNWADYTLEADILKEADELSAHAIFRYISASSHYLVLMNYANDSLGLRKRAGSGYTALANASFTFEDNVVYRLKVETAGNRFKIYIDDQLLIDDTDNSYASGSVGFRIASGGQTFFDNLSVSGLFGEARSDYAYSPVTTTPGDSVPAPGTVAAEAGSAWHVDVSWSDLADNETGYVIERTTVSGLTWGLSTTRPDFYGADYATSATKKSGSATKRIIWRPELSEAGTYDVYYWLPAGSMSYATNAAFTVHYDGGERTYTVDERNEPGGQWVLLGSHAFQAGDAGYAQLSNDANGSYVIADAIKFQKGTTEIIVDNPDAEFDVDNGTEDAWQTVGRVPADSTGFMSAGLQPGTTYRFRVYAENESGVSEPTYSANVKTDSADPMVRGTVVAPKTTAQPRKSEGSMIRLTNGDLMYVYNTFFGGTGDLDYSKLGKVISEDDGLTWSEEEILFEDPNYQLLNSTMVRLPNGNLGISYTRNLTGGHLYRVFRYSADDGDTWSAEIQVTDGSYNYMTGSHDRLVQLSDGRLIIPINVKGPGIDRTDTLVFASDDGGLTWSKTTSSPITVPGDFFAEASIVEVSPDNLLMIGNTLTGWYYASRSSDNGDTWSAPERTNLPNPKAIGRVFKLPDSNTLVFVSNPSGRKMLASQISTDGGYTWSDLKQIEYVDTVRQFYSPAAYVDDDYAYILYCDLPNSGWSGGASVRLSKLPLDWFTDMGN